MRIGRCEGRRCFNRDIVSRTAVWRQLQGVVFAVFGSEKSDRNRVVQRGCTAVTHSTVQHSFPLVGIAFANFLPHQCPPSLEQYLMHEGWIFLLTFAAHSDAPLDEVNPNLGAFPCEADGFSFDKNHLAQSLSAGFFLDISQKVNPCAQ